MKNDTIDALYRLFLRKPGLGKLSAGMTEFLLTNALLIKQQRQQQTKQLDTQ